MVFWVVVICSQLLLLRLGYHRLEPSKKTFASTMNHSIIGRNNNNKNRVLEALATYIFRVIKKPNKLPLYPWLISSLRKNATPS